jgi:DNA repair exonuclease SbcCD nuclease subunit
MDTCLASGGAAVFKFLHVADIHLDSPLAGLQRYEGAPVDEIRAASRRALENMVQLALDEAVSFVVIAGDVYDGDWPDYNTGLFFVRQMTRLHDAGLSVYIVAGNHDAANKMTKSLRLPDRVKVFSHKAAETVEVAGCDTVIHGQGFAAAAVFDNLAAGFPRGSSGVFNLGLLHTSATGHDGHERYAPCSLDDLQSRDYDYWALGHIHKRQRLACDVPAMFPGNIQGRHVREPGAKGCLLVTVDDRGRAEPRFEPLDVMRWETCELDVRQAQRGEDVLASFSARLPAVLQAAQDRPLALRVELRGACPAHEALAGQPQKWTNELRSVATDVGGGQVWLEKIKFDTSLPRVCELPTDGPIGELLQLLGELQHDDQELSKLAAELDELDRKLPAELKEGLDAVRMSDGAWLREVLQQVEPLLVSRLLHSGEDIPTGRS